MIDPTVWGPIILKITAEQRYFLKKEFGITEVDLRLQSLQDVSELINGLASIAFYEFNHEHQRTERADCALAVNRSNPQGGHQQSNRSL